jgi:hypothetical protein
MNSHATTRASRFVLPKRRTLLVAVVALAVAFCRPSQAEETTGSPTAAAASDSDAEAKKLPADERRPPGGSAAGRIRYVGPDTYILLDSEGRPQPMPGMSYEDFLAAWKKLNATEMPERQPGYEIENLDFDGQVVGERTELDCLTTVRLLADGSADVPLGLVGSILQGDPRFGKASPEGQSNSPAAPPTVKGTEFEHLKYDANLGGYVARFVGRSGDRRTLSLHLIVPLQHDGSETTLPINCPRALSSKLTLKTGSEISEVRANSGTLLSQAAAPKGGTIVKVAGPVGLFRLTWQSAAKDSPAIASVLNALGAIHVTIDGRGVRSDARITVRSYGGTFDQFRVRLPAGAQLIQARPASLRPQDAPYRIRVEPDSAPLPPGKADVPRQVVVVELPEKQKGPVVVDLATEQSGSVDGHEQQVSLAGFEVLGAVRQFGDVALNVADDWQARWEIGSYARQVDPSELDPTLQTFKPTAAFQYDRQPWSLGVRVARRQLRVHVTPKYEVECLPEETRLAVRLAYQVFGARAFEFRIELNGWEITGDPIESGSLVDQDKVYVTPDGMLVLPLVQASSRRAEISFSLRRAADRDVSRLELPLPVPVADSVGTGELIVRAAPDLDLLPDLSNSSGLSAAPPSSTTDSAANGGATELHFRTLLPTAVFVTDRTNRPREVASQATTQIDVAQDVARIDQRIDYTVRFEPIAELAFIMPPELASNAEAVELFLRPAATNSDSKAEEQGTPLHLSPEDDATSVASNTSPQKVRVKLPRPQIGSFSVRIRYHIPLPKSGAADTELPIPLFHGIDGDIATGRLAVIAPRNLTVGLDTSISNVSWQAASSANGNDVANSSYVFVSDRPEYYFPLMIRAGRSESPSSTIVDRVWLQTWLAGNVEQSRAVFQFRTTGNQATIELPPDVSAGEIEVLVDRQPTESIIRSQGRIVVRLVPQATPSAAENDLRAVAHTLELRSRQPSPPGVLTRHRLTPPQIEGSTALSQVYWQIVLPGDIHVIDSPAQLTSASNWQWLGSFWGRSPIKSQADLEEWVGATKQLAPEGDQNQYLFTGLLPVSTIEFVTGPRWLIVLGASTAVLLFALIWLYVPIARKTWFMVSVVVLIVVSSIAYPTASLLLAQASVIGIVLAALALVLSWFSTRPARAPIAPLVSPSSQRIAPQRAESMFASPIVAAASTAPAASVRISDSER